ncbi:transglutaminase family protein [Rhodovulum tesquicola]|uniref:transglutaminase-like domain-containing protein n=1 Tax=Rhodovulum tesquicola TaxID=540254 RepID=UPI002096C8EC|nr:transglutaminase family protein [Rhodovulum tesquicola]MCO8146090.1 transglutaminase family protein [Rhodovulum tesquicola]
MFIRIGYEIVIDSKEESVLVLALCPHSSFDGRIIGSAAVRADPARPLETFPDSFGNRLTRLRAPAGQLRLWSDCIVEVDGRPDIIDWTAQQHDVGDLPPETLQFLTASRYCDSDALAPEALRLFGSTPPGWARVQAICNHVHTHLTFGYGFGRSTKTASDAQRERTGVCRDFAHLAIAFCRAMNIPARYASGYLGDIDMPHSGPGDFCAWFEAYLGGRWYTFDARYNTPRIGRVLMVRGRDAADGAMITSFGAHDLNLFRVWTDEVPGTPGDAVLHDMLATRPAAEALTLAPPG